MKLFAGDVIGKVSEEQFRRIKAGGALLLAPTGATVRLMESMGDLANEFESLNVAQFLARNGGFDWDSMRYRI